MRRSKVRASLIVIVRLSVMLNVRLPGPSIMLRPASPKLVPFGLVQSSPGVQNAAVLNHSFAVGSATLMDWPATAFARSDPLTPRLISSAPPSTRGLKYSPDAPVKLPLHC